MQVQDLFLRDLYLLQTGGDLLKGQEPPFLTLSDERPNVIHLNDGHVVAEQHFGLCAQPLVLLGAFPEDLARASPNR